MNRPLFRRPLPCCIMLLLLVSGVLCRADAVDEYVQKEMQEQHIPGLSLVILRNGRPVKLQGYGLENIEQGTSATADTVYALASLTKQFTATAIMLLVEDGRLRPDDKVNRYLRPAPPGWADITIRELLTHTSGIKDYISDLPVGACKGTSAEELAQEFGAMPLKFRPGTAYAYSNTEYLVLGLVIKQLTGQTYGEFLSRRVFGPLGMTHTEVNNPARIVPHRAAGYVLVDGQLRNRPYMDPTLYGNADAGLISSVADLALWDAALQDGKVLTAASQAMMFQAGHLADNTTLSYGFGWATSGPEGPQYVAHAGSLAGTSTYIIRYLQQKLTVIVLTNRSKAPVPAMARHIAALYDPELALDSPDAARPLTPQSQRK